MYEFFRQKSGLLLFLRSSRSLAQRCLSNHPYIHKKLSSKELSDLLLTKYLIYHKKGLVVFNKPHGISFAENNLTDKDDFEVNFTTLHPYLLKKLNCNELFSAKVPEKHASGVAIFCTDENLKQKIRKCLRYMRASRTPADIYECVVTGQPSRESGGFEGGITLETSPNGKQKGIKLVKESAKSKVRNGIVKPVKIEHHTLAAGELASRVEIMPTQTKWHAVRVYAATELISPILGDNVFGSLVRTVMGRPVLIDTFSPAAFQPKKVPNILLSKLNLTSREDIEIPLHLHLSRVQILNFPRKGRRIEFYANVPEYYKWTCDVLGLNIEEKPDSFSDKNADKLIQ